MMTGISDSVVISAVHVDQSGMSVFNWKSAEVKQHCGDVQSASDKNTLAEKLPVRSIE